MHGVFRGLLVALAATGLALTTSLRAQQSPDNFHWVDFHAKQDEDVVVWVRRALDPEKWSAIREIGVEYDAALVVTTLRKTPQTPPVLDTFSVWSVSLTNHSVNLLLTGANLRLLDWMLFAIGRPRDLGALYDDCNECDASTFLTAFYYDITQHSWAARWMRGKQAILLLSANGPQNVTVSEAYAVLADPNGHEIVGTWNHFDYGTLRDPEDYVYQYDVDPLSGLERTQRLNGKEADAMKRRICAGTDAVTGLARGQNSSLCQSKPQTPHRAARKPAN
ncbi:MAG: hypothetical protein ACLPH3_16050 [Terracidiphilus sp.]